MNPWIVKARSLVRRTGAIRLINHLINRLLPPNTYGQRAHHALTAALRPGDAVWDVGANVGLYSEMFCRHVGPDGLVVAFEPFAESCAAIRERLPDCAWLRVENVALGDADTIGRLLTWGDSAENNIATEADASDHETVSVPVEIRRGDTMCSRLGRIPNFIKVDVEGFEEEVLLGMGDLLGSPQLRCVVVEVHFMKLEARGQPMAPVRIEKLLRARGFKATWLGASQLFAVR